MVKNWSLRLVLGVFCLTGHTRLGSAHTTDLTHSPYWPHPKTLPASPHPLPASPPTPLQGERGVICFAYYTLVICQLVNSLTTRPLPNHLVFLLTWHIASCSFVHFSAMFLTRRVPFLSTNCSSCRKKSILAEVCFKAKRG